MSRYPRLISTVLGGCRSALVYKGQRSILVFIMRPPRSGRCSPLQPAVLIRDFRMRRHNADRSRRYVAMPAAVIAHQRRFLVERHQLPMVFDLSSSSRSVFAQLKAALWASLALETRLDNWKLPVVRAW
jgi:hypothetical protein